MDSLLYNMIIALLLIIIVTLLIIVILQRKAIKNKGKKKNKSNDGISSKQFRNLEKELNSYKSASEKYKKKADDLQNDKIKALGDCKNLEEDLKKSSSEEERLNAENKNLKCQIEKLTRENNELKHLYANETAPVVDNSTPEKEIPDSTQNEGSKGSQVDSEVNTSEQSAKETVDETPQKPELPKDEPQPEHIPADTKEVIKYASFPRSANGKVYFSDLTENQEEDSCFELKVSIVSGKATFRPLDFMKIRNYDEAMAAMQTEGVKSAVATTVLNVEQGKAHLDGKDWFIDNPAKIKLT